MRSVDCCKLSPVPPRENYRIPSVSFQPADNPQEDGPIHCYEEPYADAYHRTIRALKLLMQYALVTCGFIRITSSSNCLLTVTRWTRRAYNVCTKPKPLKSQPNLLDRM